MVVMAGSSAPSAATPDAPSLARDRDALRRVARRLRVVLRDREPLDASRLDRRDPELIAALLPVFQTINRTWVRLRVEGLENLPPGPVLFVANHNGGIFGPDLTCTMATLWEALGPAPLHALAHDFAMRHVTPLGRVLQALGAIHAEPGVAVRALTGGASVLVYPGGDLDAFRHFRHRHRVVFGKRAGFIRLAQRAGVPIVPIVAVGAHRSSIILHEGAWIARTLGLTRLMRLERFPIAVGLPWGVVAGPVPFMPLPFAIRLAFLPPVAVPPEGDVEALRDAVVGRMQAAMDELVARGDREARVG
jgi:1-acyl-sn-glycerol-3-phosphate acyltransferase